MSPRKTQYNPHPAALQGEIMDLQNQLGEVQRQLRELKHQIETQRFITAFDQKEQDALEGALRSRRWDLRNSPFNEPDDERAIVDRLYIEVTGGLDDAKPAQSWIDELLD